MNTSGFSVTSYLQAIPNSYLPCNIGFGVQTQADFDTGNAPTLWESHISIFQGYYILTIGSCPLEGEINDVWDSNTSTEGARNYQSVASLNRVSFDSTPMMAQVQFDPSRAYELLESHFQACVQPNIFPLLKHDKDNSFKFDLDSSAFYSNRAYLHSCLVVAAQHLKSSCGHAPIGIWDDEITRHRCGAATALNNAFKENESQQQILEATLGIISLETAVGTCDNLLGFSWDLHFEAATQLLRRLSPGANPLESSMVYPQIPFHKAIYAWVDILGATIKGRSPKYAHIYEEKRISQLSPGLGLCELMGCDDRVMCLISSIARLEFQKNGGMKFGPLLESVAELDKHIGKSKCENFEAQMPFETTCQILIPQLRKNITMAFLIAARIYLYSLLPGFHPTQSHIVKLVDRLTTVLQRIPTGNDGFDHSITWVYLIGGSVAIAKSPFRSLLEGRISALRLIGRFGKMERLRILLSEVWAENDKAECQYFSWRDVMTRERWELLLI
ncbi:related to C6 zink-finger protein PRO1A [Fusarium mangiferae]|uniref:Related to C6 zink-finger protein PRO1A n=1 Tax=Fusarium mangiferae TaxID=192010 RepID=A0A1L7UJA4_FUSMA|nr:uncharacterized protein FMAN_14201 [Fusarium mangiferae]CVL08135.1 related to C6 zink-finger protein PRO1A [Fusarium mangiferae]